MARDEFYSFYWSDFNSFYSLQRDLAEFDQILDELEYKFKIDFSHPQEIDTLRKALVERIRELREGNEKFG